MLCLRVTRAIKPTSSSSKEVENGKHLTTSSDHWVGSMINTVGIFLSTEFAYHIREYDKQFGKASPGSEDPRVGPRQTRVTRQGLIDTQEYL